VKFRLILGLCALAAAAVWAASAVGDPTQGPPICSGPATAVAGNYANLTIKGNQYVAAFTKLNVSGNLLVEPGACLDAFTLGTVTVGGNVYVGNGAILALGCTQGSIGPGVPPCFNDTTHDTVGGSIIADRPYTMYLDGDTISGDIRSTGGGPGVTFSPYVNFPIKDNVVGGNVIVQGWKGAWFGVIRNNVKGRVEISNIGGANPDSNEVATNTIGGNLVCFGNSPAAQLGDSGGTINTVGGTKFGECAAL
jgi:hypothetical protein